MQYRASVDKGLIGTTTGGARVMGKIDLATEGIALAENAYTDSDWALSVVLLQEHCVDAGRRSLPADVAASLEASTPHSAESWQLRIRNLGYYQSDGLWGARGSDSTQEHAAHWWDLWTESPERILALLGEQPLGGGAGGGARSEADDTGAARENARRLASHMVRERSSKLSRLLKDAAIESGGYTCAVCDLSPLKVYGPDGAAALEAHHLVPLSELSRETETRLEDLALVCASCHRVLHAHGKVRSVDQIRSIVMKQVDSQ